MPAENGYGLWLLAIANAALFIAFAFSFARPLTRRDWRGFGAFSAFIVALFAEMYGFPLTIYLLSGWLQSRWPGVAWFSHDAGHIPEMLLGFGVNPHFGPFHVASTVLILLGFWLVSAAWPVLWRAVRAGRLATTGVYARLRHPQYVGFIIILTGFLLQWSAKRSRSGEKSGFIAVSAAALMPPNSASFIVSGSFPRDLPVGRRA